MIEIVGKLQGVPYWRCLANAGDTEQKDRELRDEFLARSKQDPVGLIRSAQTALGEMKYYAGPQSGTLDETTMDALQHYQQHMGLLATGQLGFETFRMMNIYTPARTTPYVPWWQNRTVGDISVSTAKVVPPAQQAANAVAPVKSTPSGKAAKSAKPVAEAQSTTSQDTGKLGPLTQQLLKDTETWLKTVPKTRWVIQLVRSNVQHAEDFEAAADSASKALERDKLNAYSAPLTGTMRLGLLWGDFDSRQAALKAIANLPAPIAAWKPTARSVATIRTEPIG